MALWAIISTHGYECAAIALCAMGLLNLTLHGNLIRKCLGANLFSTAVFLFFGARGYRTGGEAAILDPETLTAPEVAVNVVPTSLILTGIVVSVSITAFFLALTIRIYERYGTVDLDEVLLRVAQEQAELEQEETGGPS